MNPAASKALATRDTRLPNPVGFDPSTWQILCEVIFPHVDNPRSIMLAVEYCRVRKLDILKRPVNIVPMWSSQLRKEVDTIWPSINETQITAQRSHEWAGIDAPVFGPQTEKKFNGRRKDKNGGWSEATVTLKFPEWCQVTVYRFVKNQRCAFTGEPVYWLEAYGRSGGGELPNPTWQKRPIGMLAKVAKAAALRAAFPEESPLTDDEMAGGTLDENNPAEPEVAATPRPTIASVPEPQIADDEPDALPEIENEKWPEYAARYTERVRNTKDTDALDKLQAANQAVLAEMEKQAPKIHSSLLHAINRHRLTLDDGVTQ